MKKTFLTVALLCFIFLLKAQSFFTKFPIYIGLDLGFTGNSTLNEVKISSGTIVSKPAFFPTAHREFAINLGLVKEQNIIEFGYQVIRNSISFEYDFPFEKEKFPDLYLNGNFVDYEEMNYYALRYYRNLSHIDKKWQINIGAGIGFAQFIDLFVTPDTSNLGQRLEMTIIEPKNGSTYTIDYVGTEELIKKRAFCFEANLKFQRPIGEHFVLQFWTRAILSPWYIRGQNFQITKSNNNEPPRFGSAKSNLNSIGIGIGIQYRF
jgi:hypothetical protein